AGFQVVAGVVHGNPLRTHRLVGASVAGAVGPVVNYVVAEVDARPGFDHMFLLVLVTAGPRVARDVVRVKVAQIGDRAAIGGDDGTVGVLGEPLGDQAVLDGHPVGIARDGQALVGAPGGGTVVNDHVLRVPEAD